MLVTMPIETRRRRVSSVLSRGLARGLVCMLPLIVGLPAAGQVEVFEVAPQPPVPLPIVSPGFLFVYQPGPAPPSTLGQGRWQVRFDLSESNVLHPADELEAVAFVAGRVEEIPNVGDFITYEIGKDSILIVRTAKDTIKAFHNSCLHRGPTLVEGRGNSSVFRCPFHGFAWSIDGTFRFVDPAE